MLPDRVSNPGPLTYESGALPIALRGPDNLQFKKILLHFRIIKGMPQRGKFFPASVPHHMLWEHNVTNGM